MRPALLCTGATLLVFWSIILTAYVTSLWYAETITSLQEQLEHPPIDVGHMFSCSPRVINTSSPFQLLIGIPTVSRTNDYLTRTLESITSQLSHDLSDPLFGQVCPSRLMRI